MSSSSVNSATFDRCANELEMDVLEPVVLLNRLVEDSPFIDEHFDLPPDVQDANGIPLLALGGDEGIGEVDLGFRLGVPDRETRRDLKLDVVDEPGFVVFRAFRPRAQPMARRASLTKLAALVSGVHGHANRSSKFPSRCGVCSSTLRSESPESDYSGHLRPEVQVVSVKTVDFTYGPKRLRTSGPGPEAASRTIPLISAGWVR